MINTATKIIKEQVIDNILECWIEDEDGNLELEQTDSMELLDTCEQWAVDNDDQYDEQWYSIMEVKSAKMSVDWVYLAEYYNDEKMNHYIENLFD